MKINDAYLYESYDSIKSRKWMLRVHTGLDLLNINLNKDYPYIAKALFRRNIAPVKLFCKLQGWILINQYKPDQPERFEL